MRPEFLPLIASPSAGTTYVRTGSLRSRRLLCLVAVALLGCTGLLAEVKDYSTIVVFGDSLSDSGNVAHLTDSLYGIRLPGPLINYTDGRFTDGFDTQPAALKYFGNWVEQFAASLPSQPQVRDSLDQGTNYAYGFATTGTGTSTLGFGPSNLFPVQVENVGQQITEYLGTHPKIDRKTLFIIWGGAVDILYATSAKDVFDAAVRQVGNIQRLIDAGATQIMVVNLPPLGLTPRLNGSATASQLATVESAVFNLLLGSGVSILQDVYRFRRLTVYRLDTFRLLNSIVAAPGAFAITNASSPAQGTASDPDTFLFWDDLHPTTRGHNILADKATSLLTY
jgi:phospholipase/lecithinase/hemolysin